MARKATFCVVVPAFNEERVIFNSLKSLKRAIRPEHIYLVSDGSKDRTVPLAKGIITNVLALRKNRGKAGALELLIKKFQLTRRYKYIFFFDADTKVSSNYLKEAKKYIYLNPACIVGTVSSEKHRLISAFRVFEYGFSHRLFKNGQNFMGTITVAPGCTSIYRADVLDNLDFSNKTLTEDYDLTIQIHKKKLGKIIYASRAKVITQDPKNLRDYWRQMSRWYTGGWQNMFLHKLYIPKNKLHFEVIILTFDAVFWLITLALAVFHPIILIKLLFYSASGMILIAVVVILLEKQYWALPYVFVFPFFQIINISCYVFTFFRALFGNIRTLSWQKVDRYAS